MKTIIPIEVWADFDIPTVKYVMVHEDQHDVSSLVDMFMGAVGSKKGDDTFDIKTSKRECSVVQLQHPDIYPELFVEYLKKKGFKDIIQTGCTVSFSD